MTEEDRIPSVSKLCSQKSVFHFFTSKIRHNEEVGDGAGPSHMSRVCTMHATDLNNSSWCVLFEGPLTFDCLCGQIGLCLSPVCLGVDLKNSIDSSSTSG